jgi:translocator protein
VDVRVLRSPGARVGVREVVFLLAAIAATAVSFSKVSRTAALLLVPYLLWTGFASVLNFCVWRLNY